MVLSDKLYLAGKRIAITGGTGFIGSHLLTKILEQKPSGSLLISRGSQTKRIKQHLSKVKLKVYNSAKDYVTYITDFDPDYLFILGGNADPRLSLTDPKSDLDHNLLYNFALLETLKKTNNQKLKIIYMSSVAVYGESKKTPLKESNATIPKSPYGINKLAMEGYIRFYCEAYGLKGFSVRLFSTYGPQLYKQVVYDFAKELLHNPDSLLIKGDGSEIRDLSYIDDQVNGLLLLAQKATYTGEVYNLGSGEGISISDLALKIAKIMKIHPKIIYKKEKKETHHGKIWIADTKKIQKFHHIPKISIDEGLKKTITWIKQL